jgi:anti-sigma B factor antagonist
VDIHEQTHGAVRVIRPRGPLIASDADQVKRAAAEAARNNLGRIVLDASAVPYLDSRGLEVLAELSDELGDSGLTLKMCGTNETVREVLDLTELASLFEYYEDVNSAVRSFL